MALGGLIGSRPSAAAASNGHHGTGRALLATSLRARLRRESQEARTASAKVANRRPQGVSTLGVREWQEAAMRYHDTVGEVRYCTRFLSRTLSRLDVYPARVDENGDPRPIDPLTTDPDEQLALQLWDQVQDPTGGRSQLFGRYAALRFISGESYLLASREKPDEDDQIGSQPPVDWAIVSIWELSIRDGSYRVDSEDGYEEFKIADSATGAIMPGEAIAWRLWLPHPRRRREPDSPMRPLLDVLEELRLLRLSVRSRARNRAANTDILIIPDEAFPLPNSVGDSDETLSGGAGTGAATDEDLEEDPVLDRLLETMLTPLRDEGDASAAVPPVLRVPNEYVNSFQTVSIYNRADAFPEKALRDECVIAFARGVDLPPEVVIGLADVNHWNAWQVDEQTWHHIDPTAQEMVGEFTTSFFRPTLVRQGVADPGSFLLWYSPARILVKPDRAKDANDAYDRNAISWEAYRDAMNWDEDDAPSDEELIFRSELVRSRYTVQQTPGQQSDTAPPAPVPPATDPNAPPEAPTEGARAVALYRCREKAGSRLRARLTPAERAEHKNTSNVRLAAVLGAERVAALGLRADRLVEGGADCLIAALESQLGYPEAVLVAAETEQRAAETLYDARPADVH